MDSGVKKSFTKTWDIRIGNVPDSVSNNQVKEAYSRIGKVHSVSQDGLDWNSGTDVCYRYWVRFLDLNSCKHAHTADVNFDGRKPSFEFSSKIIPQLILENYLPRHDYECKPDIVKKDNVLEQENKLPIMITHVESPTVIWGFIETDVNIENLSVVGDILHDACESANFLKSNPETNKIYGAKFSLDGIWYRVKVLKEVDVQHFIVRFIDYGNFEEKKISDLVYLPQRLQDINSLSVRVKLRGLVPTSDDQDSPAFKLAVSHLESLILDKRLFSNLKLTSKDTLNETILTDIDSGIDINQNMLDAGHVKVVYGNQNDNSDFSRHQSASKYHQYNESERNLKKKDEDTGCKKITFESGSNYSDTSQSKTRQMPNYNSCKKDEGKVNRNIMSLTDINLKEKLQFNRKCHQCSELSNVISQLNNLKKSNLELSEGAKNYSHEINFLKQKNNELSEEVNEIKKNMKEQSMNSQVFSLLDHCKKVKFLRQQFSESSSDDVIIEATKILQNASQIDYNAPIIGQCEEALETHENIQQTIKNGLNVKSDETMTLLKKRNASFQFLFDKFKDFFEYFSNAELENIHNSLDVVLAKIESLYNSFCSQSCVMSLEDIESSYTEWKDNNFSEIQDVRKTTDSSLVSFHKSMHDFILISSLDLRSEDENKVFGLEGMIQNYKVSLLDEIELSSSNEEKDKDFLSSIVSALVSQIKDTLNKLHDFESLFSRFNCLYSDMILWIDQGPSLSCYINKSEFPLKFISKEKRKDSSQSCDEKNNSLSYDEKNISPPCDEQTNSLSCDEKNNSLPCDEKNKSLSCDDKNKSLSCDKINKLLSCDEKNKSLSRDEKNNSSSHDGKNNSQSHDEKINSLSHEKNNSPSCDKKNNSSSHDEKNNSLSCDEKNNSLSCDMNDGDVEVPRDKGIVNGGLPCNDIESSEVSPLSTSYIKKDDADAEPLSKLLNEDEDQMPHLQNDENEETMKV